MSTNERNEVLIQRKRLIDASETDTAMEYLTLINNITGVKYPSDSIVKKTIDEQTYTVISGIQKFIFKYYSPDPDLPIAKVTDIDDFKKKVDEWVCKQKKQTAAYRMMIDMLQVWLRNNTRVITSDRLTDLQGKIITAHNTELTKQDHVYHLFSDGEITSTKGGVLYGERSTFSMFPAIRHKFELVLPCKHNELTYAILTAEQAEEFRKQMLALASQV